jgi:ABC-type transport system substrate-binding protein
MAKHYVGISRRDFLKRGAALGVGAVVGHHSAHDAIAASRDRITIYHSSVADSINPYNHSSSPIYGQWQHIMEPLVEINNYKLEYEGILAESWEFKKKMGIPFAKGYSFSQWRAVYGEGCDFFDQSHQDGQEQPSGP